MSFKLLTFNLVDYSGVATGRLSRLFLALDVSPTPLYY